MAKHKKLEASKLKKHTGYWMRLVSNTVSYSFARKLETSGVTVAEWVVMREMYGGDDITSPGAVSALTGLTRGAVSKLIERLLDKGIWAVLLRRTGQHRPAARLVRVHYEPQRQVLLFV